MTKYRKSKLTLIPWFLARLLCLIHLSISILLIYLTKPIQYLYYLPIIGSTLIIIEIVLFSALKFRYKYSFILLLTYSIFTILSIWFLELYRIKHLILMKNQQSSVEVFSIVYYSPLKSIDEFVLNNKYLWSQIQIQGYIFIITIIKGLCERKHARLNIIVKTWTTALDLLDFIDMLNYSKLYDDIYFVYTTLSVWSISCLQFIIKMSFIQKILLKKSYHRLGSIITDSLLSIIIIDIPYLIVRLYAIFGVKKHDYTSYFLILKNIVSIGLQIANVWNAFRENKGNKK
ncbi:hypothetical protein I4U23_023024 [Adineta vaga]|nr:hypothetical protein I4U23_023024 [Adineta vaga]